MEQWEYCEVRQLVAAGEVDWCKPERVETTSVPVPSGVNYWDFPKQIVGVLGLDGWEVVARGEYSFTLKRSLKNGAQNAHWEGFLTNQRREPSAVQPTVASGCLFALPLAWIAGLRLIGKVVFKSPTTMFR